MKKLRTYLQKIKKVFKKCIFIIKEAISLIDWKSRIRRINLFGLFGGIILSIILYLGMIFQMKMSLVKATWIICFLGLVLTCGLSFSARVRCIVLLILPQFFSKRGRNAIIGYAFIVAMTGPAANTMRNVEVLAKSLMCGQEQLKAAVKEILDILKEPLVAIKNVVKHILKSLEKLLIKLKESLIDIKNTVVKILDAIKSAFNWLGSMVNICNKQVGTPFQRCNRLFEEAIEDCKITMGVMQSLCYVANIVKGLCYSVKFLDLICMALSFVSDSIIGAVKEKLEKFVKGIQEMFYVSVHFDHDFYFKTTSSKNFSTIGKDIMAEIKARSRNFTAFFDLMSLISGIFVLWIILKALKYRGNYLSKDYFDNYFLTSEFFKINEMRVTREMETVIPLKRRERQKYIKLSSWRLVLRERMRMIRAIVFLFNSTIQLAYIMLIDFALYWVLFTIRRFGQKAKPVEMPPMVTLDVEGEGMLADLYGNIIDAFDPMTDEYTMDAVPCLPKPEKPDFKEYGEIMFYCGICWLLLLFEPYGLRLRQFVLAKYYPYRSRERAVWLYNNILRKRSGFLKIARRMLRQKFVKNKAGVQEKFGFLDMLRAKFAQNKLFRLCCGVGKGEYCMLCGKAFTQSDDIIRCERPGCPGKYCPECFKELNNTCTICLEPMEYGDMSDVSEEKDSSDEDPCKHFEELNTHCIKYARRRRHNFRFWKFRNVEDDLEQATDKEELVSEEKPKHILNIFQIIHESNDE